MTIEERVERIEYIYMRMMQERNKEQIEAYRERLNRHKGKLLSQIAAKDAYHA